MIMNATDKYFYSLVVTAKVDHQGGKTWRLNSVDSKDIWKLSIVNVSKNMPSELFEIPIEIGNDISVSHLLCVDGKQLPYSPDTGPEADAEPWHD
ncbi:MAG: hypothetical protein K2X32_07235 [Phycisphaerales bacterium]|nr:hypothetical protein [Phycisphaerales bacterium]